MAEARIRRPPHNCPGPNCNLPVEKWVDDGIYNPKQEKVIKEQRKLSSCFIFRH